MPNSVLTTLATTLNPAKCISVVGGALTITETGKQATLKSVNLVSVGSNAVGIKFDLCGFPGEKVFLVGHEIHRACDATFFANYKAKGLSSVVTHGSPILMTSYPD